MDGMRIGLPVVLALALLYWERSRRLGRAVPRERQRYLLALMTVLGIGVYFDFFVPSMQSGQFYHRAEFFHHYLGAKYARELGYSRIYACAAVAEVELGRREEVRGRYHRDLRDDHVKAFSEADLLRDTAECKSRFSSEKWDSFKRDTAWFLDAYGDQYWGNLMLDHGFNAPPVWTLIAKPLAGLSSASDSFFKTLSAIDVLLGLASLGMMFWAFGQRVGTIASVFWGCNGVSSFYWVGGAFLRQDWFFLLVASLCLARKRWMYLSGAALTWAALSRVVPLVFFVGWAIVIAFELHRRVRARGRLSQDARNPRRPALTSRETRRLLAGAAIAFSILVPASVIAAGPTSYSEFLARISVYQGTPLTDDMGLEAMLVHDWRGRVRFMRNDALQDPFAPWRKAYRDRQIRIRNVRWLLVAGLLAWTVWSLRRTRLLWVGQALTLPLVFGVLNVPNYYFSFFILAAALAKLRPVIGTVLLAAAASSQILLLSYYWVDDTYAAESWLFAILGVIMLLAMCRKRTRDRAAALPA